MAHSQDIEHQQTTLNPPPGPSPLGSENSEIRTQITDSQGHPPQLCVEVTVLRAHNIPHIENRFGRKTRFFVTIANHSTTKKTESVQIEGQTVQWEQKLDSFFVQEQSSHLILSLYARSLARRNILIGTHDIPVKSQIDFPFVLNNEDGQAGQSTRPVTLHLTITVSMIKAHAILLTDPVDLVVTQAPLNPCTCILNSCILCISVLGALAF